MGRPFAFALLLTAAPLAAIDIEREALVVLGWKDSCSVAVKHLAYPARGQAIYGEPVSSRVGTLTLAPGEEKASSRWYYEAEGLDSWRPRDVAKVARSLRELGYVRRGFPETVRPDPSTVQPGLAEILLSTRTLMLRPEAEWAGPGWRWSGADYFPLGTCALFIFEDERMPKRYAWRLARVYNPRARLERSRAHATNARLLFSAGELEAAVAESATSASLAPEAALSRYVHAGLLSLSGRVDEAMAELRAAVALEPERAKQAKDDVDFDNLRPRRDFRDLVGPSYLDRISR